MLWLRRLDSAVCVYSSQYMGQDNLRFRGFEGFLYQVFSENSIHRFTDKKENQIFLIFKEIQSGAVAKSYVYEEGLPNI
jgi:hypothetical protein